MYLDRSSCKEWVKLLSCEGRDKCGKNKENHIISTSSHHKECSPTEPRRMIAQKEHVWNTLHHPCFLYSAVLSFCVWLLLLGVICVSEVIDISPSNLDSKLCFTHHEVSHDVPCM